MAPLAARSATNVEGLVTLLVTAPKAGTQAGTALVDLAGVSRLATPAVDSATWLATVPMARSATTVSVLCSGP